MQGCCTAIHRCAYGPWSQKSRNLSVKNPLDYWTIVPPRSSSRALHTADAVTIQQYSEAEGSPAASANAFRCLDESLQGHCLPGSY